MEKINKILKKQFYKTESKLEKRVLDRLVLYDELNFVTQFEVGKYRLDIAFPEFKVGLELDGHDFHTSETQRARDELRDAYLTEVEGWIIERVPGWYAHRYPSAAIVKALRHTGLFKSHSEYLKGVSEARTYLLRDMHNSGIEYSLDEILKEL